MAIPEVRTAHARRAANVGRWGTDRSEDRRDLEAAKLAQHIREVVDAAPPFTDEQRRELAALFAAGGAA